MTIICEVEILVQPRMSQLVGVVGRASRRPLCEAFSQAKDVKWLGPNKEIVIAVTKPNGWIFRR